MNRDLNYAIWFNRKNKLVSLENLTRFYHLPFEGMELVNNRQIRLPAKYNHLGYVGYVGEAGEVQRVNLDWVDGAWEVWALINYNGSHAYKRIMSLKGYTGLVLASGNTL